MKKIKTFTSAILSAVVIFTLVACGGQRTDPTTVAESTVEEVATVAETTVTEEKTFEDSAGDKVKIGISWAMDEPDEDIIAYAEAAEFMGAEAVYLPQIKTEEDAKKALAMVDALVMTGGEDIAPSYYNEEADELLGEINEARDVSDSIILREAISEDFPTLCTCRGMQFLNVLCGGTLYQDLPSQNPSEIIHRDPERTIWVYHNIEVTEGTLLAEILGKGGNYEVNSWHHQAIKDLGENLEVVAKASDGIIEAVVKRDNSFVIGVQYHPEAMHAEGKDGMLPLYGRLIEEGAKRTKK